MAAPTDAVEDQSAEVKRLRALAEDACRDAERARQGERRRCAAVVRARAYGEHPMNARQALLAVSEELLSLHRPLSQDGGTRENEP